MAEASGRGAGKPSTAGTTTPGGSRTRGKRGQGGRVVESRYLQYERKAARKAPVAEAGRPSGKAPEAPRKATLGVRGKVDGGGTGKGDLQSTLLEGHGTAPPDLDVSAINDKSMVRRTPQLERMAAKKPKPVSFMAPQKRGPDPLEVMGVLESQTVLLSLLVVKMEKGLAQLEENAERSLLLVGEEAVALQHQVLALRRQLLLGQRTQELAQALDAQVEMLGPCKEVAARFREQYKTFATALDTTRHELPVRAIHLQGGGHQLLDALQAELVVTQQLLQDLGLSGPEDSTRVLGVLGDLRDLSARKDLELRRTFAQVLELSAEASKEAALANQAVWEKAHGLQRPGRWYFSLDSAPGGDTQEATGSALLGAGEPQAL